MDALFEFLFELIFEGSLEAAKSKKLSKWIRYPLIVLISLFIVGVLGGCAAMGIYYIVTGREGWIRALGGVVTVLDGVMIYAAIQKIKAQIREKRSGKAFSVEEVTGEEEEAIRDLALMAAAIWREHYASILSSDQIDYMLDKFQSEGAIAEQIAEGYRYCFAKAGGKRIGYFAFYPREDAMYLSKWYLLREYRGKGYARPMLDYVTKAAKEMHLSAIELNVNRYNATVAVYEHLGFRQLRAEKNDIGSGYFMDDYVYRLDID